MNTRHTFTLVLIGFFLLVSSAMAVSITIPNAQVNSIGSTATVNLVLDAAPNGLAGYNFTVIVSNPSVAEIAGATYPAWATYTDNSSFPGSTVWIKGVDLGSGTYGNIGPGATNVPLANLTVRGLGAGSTTISIIPEQFDDDFGGIIAPSITNGTFTVNVPPTVPVAAFSAAPLSGNAPLTVHFTDASTGSPTSWAWDFDNDGDVDSTAKNPQFTYTIAGSYSVNLTVTNAAGSNSLVKTGYITVAATSTTVFFNPPSKPVATGATTSMTLYGSIFPAGLSGFNITVSLANPQAGEITGVTFPAWAALNSNTSAMPSDTIWFSGVDVNKQIGAGATNVTLGTILIRGDTPGSTDLVVDVIQMDADGGGIITPAVENGNLIVEGVLTAGFSAAPTSGQAPLTVQFTDASSGSPTTWAWDFTNDGTIDSNAQNPQFTYNSPGSYSVSLTVSNATASDTETKTGFITVSAAPPAPPVANFMASPRSGPAPLTVQFNDTSTGTGITTWAWDLDNDGDIDSTARNPQFTYHTPGSYSVNLTVTNSAGSNSRVKTDFIIVNAVPVAPVADFNATPTSGAAPLTVQFTDASTGSPTFWAWDFDNDGVVDSNDQSPQHVYNNAGTYTVNLTVTNAAGSNTRLKTNYITVIEVTEEPVADFTGNPTSGQAPLTVQFTDASTGSPTSWAWDFTNDGTIDSNAQNPQFTYNSPGSYSVSLTVTNNAGSNDRLKTDYITVTEVTEEPVADFTGNPTSGQAPLTVQFTDASSGSPTTWAWDFNNDGTVDSTEQNPQFTYNSPGSYSVSLTVTNNAGSDDRLKTDYITVTESPVAPVADFTGNPTSGQAPLTVQFTDASSGSPTTWAWDFNNDGTVDSTEQNPQFTYNSPGSYSVSLTVTNNAGSDDRLKTDYITVTEGPVAPVADFTGNPTSGQAPLTVQFTDASTGGPTSWAWDFDNDGTVDSNAQNPQFTYNSPGSYSVSLTVTNNAGSDTELKTNYITVTGGPVAPVADFIGAPTSGQAPLTVQFADASSGSPTSWAWDFNNDGIVDSTAQYPQFTYTAVGSYSVSLTVTNNAGSDTELKTNYITVTGGPVAPVAAFTGNPTSGQAPLTVQFTDASSGSPTSWAWDFQNDGIIDSNAQNPQFTYNSPGSYSVSLTVTNNAGSDTELKMSYITVTGIPPVPGVPVANFVGTPTSGSAPLTVQFTDLSTGNPTQWNWDFNNDGFIDSTSRNQVVTFRDPGDYTVRLWVYNSFGGDGEIKSMYIHVTGAAPAFPADLDFLGMAKFIGQFIPI